MDRLIWEDEFSAGIQFIDEQHKVLVTKLNDLIDAYQSDDDTGEAEWLLLDFLKKCQQHVDGEQIMLTQQGYNKLETIARYLSEFGDKVEDLHRLSLLIDKEIPVSLILFLRQWITDHLRGKEMKRLHSLLPEP